MSEPFDDPDALEAQDDDVIIATILNRIGRDECLVHEAESAILATGVDEHGLLAFLTTVYLDGRPLRDYCHAVGR